MILDEATEGLTPLNRAETGRVVAKLKAEAVDSR